VKRTLDQYAAALSPAEIAAGMNAAATNARRLLEDAKRLLVESRFPTALSLAALSIEESGKVSILRSLALARYQKELAETWREYRSHTRKNRMWLFGEMVAKGARRLGDFRELFDEEAEHPFLLDNLKQLGFYTDCLGKRHWAIPDQVIDGNLARQVVQIAELLSSKREVTEREIVLWVEHVKPVWKTGMEHMEAAVAAWHRQMCAEGLATDPDLMERFIVQGIDAASDDNQASNHPPEGTR
jgi:AbiV family abortive infection protein